MFFSDATSNRPSVTGTTSPKIGHASSESAYSYSAGVKSVELNALGIQDKG